MYLIDNIAFDDFEIESLNLNLNTCVVSFEVIYHKDHKRITKTKTFTFPTDCNVDINKLIDEIYKLHGKDIL